MGVAIGNGVLSMMLIKCERRCCIMFFGSSLGASAIIVLAIGSIFAFQTQYMPNAVNVLCHPKNTPQQQPFMQRSYLDTNMLYQVNLHMCTDKCPCDDTSFKTGYSSVSEEDFGYHGRTNSGAAGKLPIKTVPNGGFNVWDQCSNTTLR